MREVTMYEHRVKPAVDRAVALALLVLLLPILATIALCIRLSLGRGVIYRQRRVGLHGVPFTMYKFRTMHPDRRTRERHFHGRDRRRTHKTPHDPRHTTLGQFLRRYSLDELPQLWNVLTGELSLVGPRPELLSVVERRYEEWQHHRHAVRPGLTGLWQVTQRDEHGQMHRHVDVDLRYIERLSPGLDLAILVMTLPIILHITPPDVFGLRSLGATPASTGAPGTGPVPAYAPGGGSDEGRLSA